MFYSGLDVVNACPVNHSVCINTVSSYICTCEEHYTGDGTIDCVDINECLSGMVDCGTLDNGNIVS